MRVLIVDDHAGFRSLARRMLEGEGHTVVGEADTGASAVVESGRVAPEVVLLDLHLPDASGLAVAEWLTAGDPSPTVVLTSTHDEAELDALAREHGASGFVPKLELTGETLAAACRRG